MTENTNTEDINITQSEQRWCIDLTWFQQNNRSLSTLAQSCLCPKCGKNLTGNLSNNDFLSSIKDCCAKAPTFITDKLPILESVFRFFLASGNQPLDLKELGRQLSEWRGGDAYATSMEILSRLLKSDQYYGLSQVQD
ncbi:hypothetical protein ACFLTK_04180 [Chloroflexota bacterium]